ncbi:MAG: murein peptide amidase A [Bacteriovoracaceae bacterium]|nr:murein peptide amidase A [Bacteriovoracaceae bacterium]
MFIILARLFLMTTSSYSQEFNLKECFSTDSVKINHYEKSAKEDGLKKRILVFGQIHGDEPSSGKLAQFWIERLKNIDPSNFWRIIPILNPDGSKLNIRMNANGVDLNRNFPTSDWNELALKKWKNREKSDPRRFPGHVAGSEKEVRCAIAHIEDFRPDLVISIHTPYGVFDFDGPPVKKYNSKNLLPWKRLGTFTGSLGRYVWDERNIPVLTIELKEDSLNTNSNDFIKLQDRLSRLITN